jgi:hypothetical protein
VSLSISHFSATPSPQRASSDASRSPLAAKSGERSLTVRLRPSSRQLATPSLLTPVASAGRASGALARGGAADAELADANSTPAAINVVHP